MQKTLGGDRLGSGKKMKVNLHGYERSTHDLGYVMRTTMAAGTLVPFIKEVALPGDTFDIDLNIDVKTHPTAGPLFGSYKVQADVFTCPVRLYQGQLHNNKLGIGLNMASIKLPRLKLLAPPSNGQVITDIDNIQINPSSILSYLGIRGVGTNRQATSTGDAIRYFNAIPLLGYWDIYKNYYANKQEEIGAVIHQAFATTPEHIVTMELNGDAIGPNTMPNPPVALPTPSNFVIENDGTEVNPANILIGIKVLGVITPYTLDSITHLVSIVGTTQTYIYNTNYFFPDPEVAWYAYGGSIVNPTLDITTFPLINLDTIREAILTNTQTGVPFEVNETSPIPFSLLYEGNANLRSIQSSQEGLAIKTYQSDLLNNWLSTEWIDGSSGISEITAIDTSGGSFTMDTLNLSKKVYDMLNRIAVSGGTYDDWQETVYDHQRYTKAETPTYHGGLIKELVFQEVVSNSAATTDVQQPLGTLAGRGVLAGKHKGGQVTIRVDEPCFIIGIISLTPRLDYSQGNDWDIHLETMDDFHKPALDEIGFQELITERMAWWDTNYNDITTEWETKSAGKQPAWIEYMTNLNRVRGNFAIQDNEMFMTLNRRYEPEIGDDDVTIKDLTTYIDPRIYNNIFADTALDSQNFWTQIAVNMTARRKLSARIMPNL